MFPARSTLWLGIWTKLPGRDAACSGMKRPPACASNTVTAIRTPAGVDAREVIRIGLTRYNTSFGSGLAQLAGKVFRIGHLGDLNEGMCLTALAVAELSLRAAGANVALGTGVAAAQEVYEQDARVLALAAE